MLIATMPNRKSPPAILLRESHRENGKVKSRMLANLSILPPPAIAALRGSLKGQPPAPLHLESLQIIDSLQHGSVQAVLDAMKRLKIAQLIDARPSPERDRVVALIAARVIEPQPGRCWRSGDRCCTPSRPHLSHCAPI